MSPIDDELRSALQRRAGAVAPAADPLAGIERRAGRMRRNRIAASVAGSVLAVAAVATAVPLLTSPTVPDAPPVALTPPTADPSPAVTTSAYALDPATPWAYRGTPVADLGQGFLETATLEYATKRGVDEDAVTVTPLWGQVDEPSAQSELVFLAEVDGEDRWGVVRSSESGAEFPVDEPLPDPALALAAALPGDEVARLVVVAAPTVSAIEHGPDDASEYAAISERAPGVGITALEGDPASATYRVLDPSGTVLLQADVPEVAAPAEQVEAPQEPEPASELPPPTNVVDWPLRGAVPDALLAEAEAAAAEQAGVAPEQITSRRLFGTERDGTAYGLAQVWSGGDAQMLAWAKDLDDDRLLAVLLPPTAPGPAAVAVQFDDVVMVVPEPRTGQVLYAPAGSGDPVPVPDQGTEAAVLVDRPSAAPDDRLLILDGNGDPERPVYRGTVDDLLAASAS